MLATAVPALRAATTVDTYNTSVTATVGAVNAFTRNIRKIADNSADTAISFGAQSSAAPLWGSKPSQYLALSIDDNAPSWNLRVYTDNFASLPATATWGYQYGGLKGNVDGAKAAMGWMVLPNTDTNASGGPGLGNPADGSTNGWTFIKDKSDQDDPSTASDDSFAGFPGYLNVAYGASSFTSIVRPNLTGGAEQLPARTDPFYMYFEGNFNGAPAASYSANLKLELINQ
jgi:hypothetical protein